MGYFANLTAKLGVDTSQFNKGLRAASAAVTRFSKQVAKDFRTTSKSAASVSNSFKILGNTADKGYKSVRRIVQGIIISQAFYRTVHAIQDVTKELYNFSQAAEESRVAFTGLIGDADKAKRFNETLQDLAADTPYTYEQAADNARMLLAYEFKLQNMERIMRSIADAAAASGKVESYRSISEALGQIQAKGRLTARELIRLANAGIPAYQILREELGLTHEQITNLGKTPIPADIAIPAILRGMEKRYAGASAAMQRTTRGLANAIRENLLIIGQNVFDPLYQNFRVNMEKISNRLEKMRDDIRKGGFGYMLANMFPPEIIQRIQLFVANIQMFIQNIVAIYKSLAPVRHAFTELFINTFNAVMPFINMFTRILAVLIQMLTSNSTAVRIFVSALGGLFIVNTVIKLILGFRAALKSLLIVKIIAQGIVYLGKAIGYLTAMLAANPLVAFIGLAVGGILAMTLASKKFGSTIDNLMSKASRAFGVDPSKIFAPKMEENTKIADEFNQELELSSEGLKKMGDKAKEAGKKAKQALMAFDEVFVLPDPDVGTGAVDLDDMFDIPDIETPAIPPFDDSEMFPDVGASITEWTQGVADSIRDKLTKALAGAGIGAVIGGIIGGIFGGLPGAVLGAKIGAAAGAIAGLFWEKLVEFFKSPTGIGATLGAIIGGIIGGPIGATVGAILGGVAGSIVGRFWEDLKKAFQSDTGRGAAIGAAIGTLIGLMVGGPMGAALGAVLGRVIGGLLPSFWERVTKWYEESKAKFDSWWKDTKSGFVNWKNETVASIVKWKDNTITNIGNWYNETKTKLGNWWNETKTGFIDWKDNTGTRFKEWKEDTFSKVSTWASETHSKFSSWWENTKSGFVNWKDNTGTRFKEWKEDTFSKVSAWASDTHAKFSSWWNDTTTGLSTWWSNTKTGFGDWKTNAANSIIDWYTRTKGKFSNWWSETSKGFSDWWGDSNKGFLDWAKGIYDDVVGWFDKLWKKLKSFFDDLKFWKKEAKKEESSIASTRFSGSTVGLYSMDPVTIGHAKGGVFNKEHIARFSEGNKMEAILPVENPIAMAKVRRAIFGGEPIEMFNKLVNDIISAQPSPVIYGGNQQPTPMYVGTLIADERGLRELERRLYDIRLAERHRRGELYDS